MASPCSASTRRMRIGSWLKQARPCLAVSSPSPITGAGGARGKARRRTLDPCPNPEGTSPAPAARARNSRNAAAGMPDRLLLRPAPGGNRGHRCSDPDFPLTGEMPPVSARLRLLREAKVAVRGAFHHGLRARELEIRIEALDHGVVAIAMDEVTQIGETELFVEFGVAAARHVEVEPIVARGDDVDIETAAPRPDFLGPRLEPVHAPA